MKIDNKLLIKSVAHDIILCLQTFLFSNYSKIIGQNFSAEKSLKSKHKEALFLKDQTNEFPVQLRTMVSAQPNGNFREF